MRSVNNQHRGKLKQNRNEGSIEIETQQSFYPRPDSPKSRQHFNIRDHHKPDLALKTIPTPIEFNKTTKHKMEV